MKSKVTIKGHPIHPMLVSFPIAFIFGALGFDLAGRLLGWSGGWTTGAYLSLAAVVAGVAAGIPGLIDYLYAIPPDSSAKVRGTRHMIVNLAALAACGAGWLFRDRATLVPGAGTLLLEAAGVGLVAWGGWLGGTLVFRNQIGVDHRYAGAGKWKEQDVVPRPDRSIIVAREGELEVGQMKLLHLGDRRIVLARTAGGYRAFDDHCPHRGGPLSDGALVCGSVQCPWHGSQFDVETGQVEAGPATEAVPTYPTEVKGGEVYLILEGRELLRTSPVVGSPS